MADKYDKMTQREHILARPDTYIGDVEPTKDLMWVYENNEIIKKEILYTPGFYKIYDEILINARDASVNDPSCNTIKIEYNKEEQYISVYNNGDIEIPIEEHPKHKILVPTMIFGELLTSSNYNDDLERTTGGRNGLGSKCMDPNTILYNYYDGAQIIAKDLKIGNQIIGDDGLERNVLKVDEHYGEMYEIKQQFGETYKVNNEHILVLLMQQHKKIIKNNSNFKFVYWNHIKKDVSIIECENSTALIEKIYNVYNNIDDNNIIEISVKDFIKLDDISKSYLCGFKSLGIDWKYKEVSTDPYIVGTSAINNNELINKRYLINARYIRFRLLKGILYACKIKNYDNIIINSLERTLDIIFLIKSLGIDCSYQKSDETYIIKHQNLLDNYDIYKSNIISNGCISINKIDNGDYISILIDKNQRFIINDFTVTHNCANIFSTKFIVEIDDAKRKKRFMQTWENNMLTVSDAIITKLPAKIKSSVKITFYPDMNRFGIDSLDNDHYNLFHKRAYDIAGATANKIAVFFNNEKINIINFKSYIELYYPKESIYFDSKDRWDIGIIYNGNSNNETISFVNGINTFRGGTHCNNVIDNFIKILINDYIKKKDKDFKLNASAIKGNFSFFINSVITNPSFSSQTKDTLTTKVDKFGSKYEFSEAFIKKISKCGIINQMVELSKFKESSNLKKTDGKKQIKIIGIPKLEDANKAGSKDANKCTLILTEGDSAKATAMAGISVVGRDYFGVFPLKGKLLNVRDATTAQILNNEEIKHLKTIIGLKQNEKYTTEEKLNTLRYGKVLLLTDSDVDGSHIKGLVINMFHSMWPELIKQYDFIQSLNTPIIKATKGKQVISFYNLTEYDNWKITKDSKSYKIKYYKGLGTSTSAEAKEYFTDICDKIIKYYCDGDDLPNNEEQNSDKTNNSEEQNIDDENNSEEPIKKTKSKKLDKNKEIILLNRTDKALILAFDKSKTNERKQWLMNYDKDNIIKDSQKKITYHKFIN